MQKDVTQGKSYCLTVFSVPCKVTAIGENNIEYTLLNVSETGQYLFIAPTWKVNISQDDASIVETFNLAGTGKVGGTGSGSDPTYGFLKIIFVDALPPISEAKENTLYFVPKITHSVDNYDEYIFDPAHQEFELVGSTSIDTSDLAKLSSTNIFLAPNTFNEAITFEKGIRLSGTGPSLTRVSDRMMQTDGIRGTTWVEGTNVGVTGKIAFEQGFLSTLTHWISRAVTGSGGNLVFGTGTEIMDNKVFTFNEDIIEFFKTIRCELDNANTKTLEISTEQGIYRWKIEPMTKRLCLFVSPITAPATEYLSFSITEHGVISTPKISAINASVDNQPTANNGVANKLYVDTTANTLSTRISALEDVNTEIKDGNIQTNALGEFVIGQTIQSPTITNNGAHKFTATDINKTAIALGHKIVKNGTWARGWVIPTDLWDFNYNGEAELVVRTPTTNNQAANKLYVDTAINSLAARIKVFEDIKDKLVLTDTEQTITGSKTFSSTLTASNGIDLAGSQINNLANGTNTTDAVNFGQLPTQVNAIQKINDVTPDVNGNLKLEFNSSAVADVGELTIDIRNTGVTPTASQNVQIVGTSDSGGVLHINPTVEIYNDEAVFQALLTSVIGKTYILKKSTEVLVYTAYGEGGYVDMVQIASKSFI